MVDGRLIIDSNVQHGDERLGVRVQFSHEHPFVAPTVVGERLVLNRHQQPFGLNFCLDRPDRQWWTPDHTTAELLAHLEGLLAADAAGELDDTEADMPEPISGMFPNTDESVVIGGPLLELELAVHRGQVRIARSQRQPHLWAVDRIETGDGRVQPVLSKDELARLGIREQRMRARVPFQALELPAGAAGAQAALKALQNLLAENAAAKARRAKKANAVTAWAAVTFVEEGPRRCERQRAWLFHRQPVNLPDEQRDGNVLRTQALDLDVRQLRVPELVGLETTRFVVVGAGSLGGHAICELARAGVGELHIVDGDVYDINNSVRHALPVTAAGRNKAEAMRDLAENINPHGSVRAHPWSVEKDEQSRRAVAALIARADVVIDAAGSHAVTRLLHWRCATLGTRALVSAALTPGGYGGRVVVLRDHSPCFDCFLTDPEIPRAAEGPIDNATPHGCSHPAASCAGFDVTQLAAITARTAVRAVRHIAYPTLDYDWAVVNFRPRHPPWTQGHLTPQADCAGCQR